MSAQASYVLYVKGDPATRTLGSCPFCHRALLHLETKNIPYQLEYIDFANKPEWLVKLGGTVPVIKDGETMLADSGKIVEMLEEKHPEVPMKSDLPADFGAALLPAFRAFLLAGGDSDEVAAKKQALYDELKIVNDKLTENKGRLFGGDHLNATDAVVGPRLYNIIVALRNFKNWSMPPEFTAIKSYWAKLRSMPAWLETDYGSDVMIDSWTKVILGTGH